MKRLEYADANRCRYYNYVRNVRESPYTDLDKMEFALISAHTPMDAAINGWLGTRDERLEMDEYANKLNDCGVLASFNKTAYVWGIRALIHQGAPYPDGTTNHRQTVKFPGLGYCKSSFAACLIAPLTSRVVCLDTHMLQVLLGRKPDAQEINRIYRRLDEYEYLESILEVEAYEVDMPLFAYQWAVWDWQRLQTARKPTENHSFLWESGRSTYQLPLFSGLEE